MTILHLCLRPNGDSTAEVRLFHDNPNQHQHRILPLEQIRELLRQAETGYYVQARMQIPHGQVGRQLYQWLEGEGQLLSQALEPLRRTGGVIAVSVAGQLGRLPWEVLHDGRNFLVAETPAIVPVRWQNSEGESMGDPMAVVRPQGEPVNRSLHLLFMAASPQDVEPVLDYEGEESRILAATSQKPGGIQVTVEESGCITELGDRLDDYGRDAFEVFHFTGHGSIAEGQPFLVTETETGAASQTTAEDLGQVFQLRFPPLVFLSACRSGQDSSYAQKDGETQVPALAAQLIQRGARSVLGWGYKVLDTDATLAAEKLYAALAVGRTLTEALALTYQAMLQAQARDWHLLRLYCGSALPQALVTPPRTPWPQTGSPAFAAGGVPGSRYPADQGGGARGICGAAAAVAGVFAGVAGAGDGGGVDPGAGGAGQECAGAAAVRSAGGAEPEPEAAGVGGGVG